ncbi:pyridoxal phosphate-dependent transferase [Paraphysoderma sedebokerense]|nr:pyridoxal phosphate-dependent transferase [Paraphysoderma sedebokerense]
MDPRTYHYFDYNATTPLAPEVIKTIYETSSECWANPSSNHPLGRKAKECIDIARKKVAKSIGASESEIIFTSGGTESNHMVFHSVLHHHNSAAKVSGVSSLPHIVTTAIEHPATLLPLKRYHSHGQIELTLVSPTPSGHINPTDIIQALKPNTVLVSIMLANNETGCISDIAAMSDLIRNWERSNIHDTGRIKIHTDAAQAIGKLKVDVKELNVDYLTVVGHKFYGPRIGALYVQDLSSHTVPAVPIFLGGGQEHGYRAGTENTPMIAALGEASELVVHNIESYIAGFDKTISLLQSSLVQACRSIHLGLQLIINGIAPKLPNTFNVSIIFKPSSSAESVLSPFAIPGPFLKSFLESRNVFIGLGAACHSSSSSLENNSVYEGSEILKNMGVELLIRQGAMRISVGRETNAADIDALVKSVADGVKTYLQQKTLL